MDRFLLPTTSVCAVIIAGSDEQADRCNIDATATSAAFLKGQKKDCYLADQGNYRCVPIRKGPAMMSGRTHAAELTNC
jgi:hypothetical protein